jgi:hypothetical protein
VRLSPKEKAAALANRPGAKLVRVGSDWCAVWYDTFEPPASRWRGQVVTKVEQKREGWAVWWAPEVFARTRREVVQLLATGGNP